MSGRSKEELNGVTLLGNQKTRYKSDYAPEVLETCTAWRKNTPTWS